MSIPSRFQDPEYKNWLKCHLSLLIMKEGLHSFIDTETRNLHADIEQKVTPIPHGPSVVTKCGQCTWKDIRRGGYQKTWSMSCKMNICNRWLSQILALHHDPHNPSICWRNSDISQWPTDPYAVAKVYMPKGQDRTKNLPQDLDAFAVLSLVKYCTWISRKVPNTQILSDLIDVRNKLMHSGDLRVSDTNKDAWIDLMIQLMVDLNINSAVRAELQKIKVEDIDITFRETEVRILRSLVSGLAGDLDGVKTNIDNLQTAQYKLQSDLDKGLTSTAALQVAQAQQGHELQKIKDNTTETTEKMVSMETDTTRIKTEVQKLTESSQKISSFLSNNPDIIDKDILATIDGIEKTLLDVQSKRCEVEKDISDIKREIREMKSNFSEIQDKEATLHHIQQKDVLHHDLLSRYKSFRTIPISPTDEIEGVPLDYLYTDITIKCEDTDKINASSYKGGHEEKLKSYKQLFCKKNERIILSGLSGSGKSTFCKRIVSTWYKVYEKQLPNSNTIKAGPTTREFTREIADEEVLLRFDLLFYINSPAISNETQLVEVLYNQCLKKENSEKETICERISKILSHHPEQILIIFDGLDEMGHTPDFLIDVLKRKMHPRLTVVMAMRQWRISRLGLRPLADYDLYLDVQGFSEHDALTFARKVIDLTRNMYGQAKEKELSVNDEKVLLFFRTVPLLLLFLVHIWYRDKSLPETNTCLYSQIIDCLIERCLKKTGSKYTENFPDQESMQSHVKMFRDTYLKSACKAAHHFLMHKKRTPSVVIPEKELTLKLGDKAALKLSALLCCGIISYTDSFSPLEKNISVTFLHMSIQEYLASIHLVENEDEFLNFLSCMKTLNDVLRYGNCLIFICGMDATRGQRVYSRICQLCEEDPLVLQYRGYGDELDQLQSIMNMNKIYQICLNEMDNQMTLDISDIFPTLDENIFSRLGKSSVRSLYMDQTNTTPVFFVPDLTLLTNLTALTLSALRINPELSRSLCIGISSCVHLRKLDLRNLNLLKGILDLSRLTNLTFLTLSVISMTLECTRSVCDGMSGCIQLKELKLHRVYTIEYCSTPIPFPILNDCISHLCESINGCTHLEMLSIANINVNGILNFSNLNCLTSLTLVDVGMSKECGESLCRTISACTLLDNLELQSVTLYDGVSQWKNLTNLTSLIMRNITNSGESSCCLCSSISGCTRLEYLYLTNITLNERVIDLSSLHNLTSFTLSSVTISEECCESMCNSIKDCIHMEKLELRNVKLHDVELDLRNLRNLVCLQIHKVAMSRFISRSISACILLEKLELSGSLISPLHENRLPTLWDKPNIYPIQSASLDTMESELINLHGELDLRCMTNLNSLLLCNVTISEQCAKSLCESINGCIHLKSLELKNIDLHESLLDLSRVIDLISLSLSCVTMSEKCRRCVCSSISRCIQLEKIKLVNLGHLDDTLDLQSHLDLQYVMISGCTCSQMLKDTLNMTRLPKLLFLSIPI